MTIDPGGLDQQALPNDVVGLLEGISTTRAIRRYRDEPVPGTKHTAAGPPAGPSERPGPA